MDSWQNSSPPGAPAVGDAETLAVYMAHRPGLERYVRSLVRDPEQAADVCQDVFLRLLLASRAGAAPAKPAAWMNRVAHNIVVSAARRRQVAEHAVERLVTSDMIPSTEETVIGRERDATLQRALDGAGAADRKVMVLAAQGFRGGEIADAIGRTELATRTLLCRARGRMRSQLASLEPA